MTTEDDEAERDIPPFSAVQRLQYQTNIPFMGGMFRTEKSNRTLSSTKKQGTGKPRWRNQVDAPRRLPISKLQIAVHLNPADLRSKLGNWSKLTGSLLSICVRLNFSD